MRYPAQDQRAWEEAGQAALGAPLWDLVQNKKPVPLGAPLRRLQQLSRSSSDLR